MHAVYADNAVQVIGNQGTAGTENMTSTMKVYPMMDLW